MRAVGEQPPPVKTASTAWLRVVLVFAQRAIYESADVFLSLFRTEAILTSALTRGLPTTNESVFGILGLVVGVFVCPISI